MKIRSNLRYFYLLMYKNRMILLSHLAWPHLASSPLSDLSRPRSIWRPKLNPAWVYKAQNLTNGWNPGSFFSIPGRGRLLLFSDSLGHHTREREREYVKVVPATMTLTVARIHPRGVGHATIERLYCGTLDPCTHEFGGRATASLASCRWERQVSLVPMKLWDLQVLRLGFCEPRKTIQD